MPLVPEDFRAPFISKEDAWSAADRVRREHCGCDDVPVEVESILWRLGVRVEPIQSLREAGDVVALLRGDLSTVIVDANDYMDDRQLNRVRFSMAHELGHLILHRDLYGSMQHATVEEWVDFMQKVPDGQWSFVEFHAYEFAGRLLVPADRLRYELTAAAKVADAAGFSDWDDSGSSAREYISNSIARVFGVSGQVIDKRILRENLWPPPGLCSAERRDK